MRIAINCRSILLNQLTGIGRATYHLLDSLGAIDHANEYILHAPKRLLDFKRHLPDFSRYHNFKRRVDFFSRGAGEVAIYHYPSPDAIVRAPGKLVVTVHDLIYKAYPQSQTSQSIELTEKYMQAIAAQAHRIICVSENTRRDLHAFLNIPVDKTCVVYNGVDHKTFYPLSEEQRRQAASRLRVWGIDKPYVLYVGTLEPRKNLTGLLDSFAGLKSKKVFHGQLVIAGMKGWMQDSIGRVIEQLGIKRDVIFTGFVSDDQLRELYNLAELFVFPSFYEGFGFPILEAFSCGVPVVTSKTSSCGEIAGEAALTVDPQDPSRIAQAMTQILQDKMLKKSLRQTGFKRAQEFSFAATARETLAVYQQMVNI